LYESQNPNVKSFIMKVAKSVLNKSMTNETSIEIIIDELMKDC